jgi:hypothetical protein
VERIRSFLKWLWAAWPLWLFIIAISLYKIVGSLFFTTSLKYNFVTGTVFQILGTLSIIVSINQNIELFNQKNIIHKVTQYIKSCPLIRHTYNLEVQDAIHLMDSSNATLTVRPRLRTTKEKLEDLQRQITETNKRISLNEKQLSDQIIDIQKKVNLINNKTEQKVQEVNQRLIITILGGIKLQILGILLVVFGLLLTLL